MSGCPSSPAHLGRIEVAPQGCHADLGVPALAIIPPTRACVMSLSRSKVRSFTLSGIAIRCPFQSSPEGILLGILIGTAGQRGLVQNAQGVQSLHGGAVAGHQGLGQRTLLQRLIDPVQQDFGGLVRIPLEMADQSGVIVDNVKQQRDLHAT